jgi:tetratricopeptide (TPR) repeat protein
MAPADGNWQRNIVFVLQKIGDVRQELEEWPSAVAVYKAALDIMQKLADGAPNNRLWQRDLANTVSRLGQALAGNRDFDAALEQYQLALKIRTDLWRKDPKDDVLQSNLATSRREIARLYTERGKLEDALAEYRIAIGILEPLAFKDPANITWQISLAPLYSDAGAVLRRQNNLPAALEQFRNAYRVRRDLALRDPTNPVRQDKSATTGMAIAELLVLQNQNLDEAVKLYRSAIDSLDDWRPRYDRDIFRCYIGIGNIFASQTKPEAALTEYRVALAIARESATRNPADVWWRKNLINAVFQIGEVLKGEGRIAEAIAHYQKVLEFVQGLADEHPKIAEWAALAQSLQAKIDTLKS